MTFRGILTEPPRAPRRGPPETPQSNLLETTLRSQDKFPIRQMDWPLPILRVRAADYLPESNLLEMLYVGKDALPFRQRDWPNPVLARKGAADVLPQSNQLENVLLGLDVLPFNQNDWPKPILAIKIIQGESGTPFVVLQQVPPPPITPVDLPLPLHTFMYQHDVLLQNQLIFTQPGPTPPPTPGGGNSGPSETFSQWLERYPWLRNVELRPNWYHYPEVKKLKKDIVRAVKAKKRAEQQLSFAKGTDDLTAQIEALNALQAKVNALMSAYQQMLSAVRGVIEFRQREEEEEAEFMELLAQIL